MYDLIGLAYSAHGQIREDRKKMLNFKYLCFFFVGVMFYRGESMRNPKIYIFILGIVMSIPGYCGFGIQPMAGWATYSLKTLNNSQKAKSLVPFDNNQFNYSGRLFWDFGERITLGAQITDYYLNNGGTYVPVQQLGVLILTDEYKATPIFAMMGVNIMPTKQHLRLDLFGGYGFMLKNEFKRSQVNKGGGAVYSTVYNDLNAHGTIGGLDFIYMFTHGLGFGFSGHYMWLKSNFISNSLEVDMSGFTASGALRIVL